MQKVCLYRAFLFHRAMHKCAILLAPPEVLNYSYREMDVHEGTPWQPMRLDDLIEEPFERLREQQEEHLLDRMDQMIDRLQQIERDLDGMLATSRAPHR